MIKTFLIFLLYISLSFNCFSQTWRESAILTVDNYNKENFSKAIDYGKRTIEIAEKEYGKKSEEYLTSLNNLAIIYFNRQQFISAEPLYTDAVELTKILYGESNEDLAMSFLNVAATCKANGNYQKSEKYYLSSKSIYTKLSKEKSQAYSGLLHNLAELYVFMGQYNRGEKLYFESLNIIKDLEGEKSESYATMSFSLSSLYYYTGQYEKAEEISLNALKIYKEKLGEQHLYYTIALDNLASLYQKMGQYEKSESLYKEAINIENKIIDKKNKTYAQTLNNLAGLYFNSKQYSKAEPIFKEVLNIRKNSLGEKHPDYIISLNNLGTLYIHYKKFDLAEKLLLEGLRIGKEILGKNHPYILMLYTNLGILYRDKNNFEGAEPYFKEANNNILNQINTNFPYLSEKEKLKFISSKNEYLNRFYSFAINRYKEDKNVSTELFNMMISLKGLILNSAVQTRNRILHSGDNDLIKMYNNLTETREKILSANSLTKAEQDTVGINISELESKANSIEKSLNEKSEIFKNVRELKEITFKDVAAKLKKDEASVEFLSFNNNDVTHTDTVIYIAVITKASDKSPVIEYLCKEEQLSEFFSAPSESDKCYVKNIEQNKKLYELIWKPIDKYLTGIKNVYVSPSGLINKISLSTLTLTGNELLCDKYSLYYIGNTKEIVLNKNNEKEFKSISGLNIAVFGGAKFDVDSLSLIENSKFFSRGSEDEWVPPSDMVLNNNIQTKSSRWSYLPGTLEEADKIKSIFESNKIEVIEFSGVNASKEALKYFKKSPSVLHIATHGFFFPEPSTENKESGKNIFKTSDNPLLRSGLILAGANRVWTGGNEIEGVENGILTAYEVANMDLQNTELVVLSACETGLGDIKGGEGVYGLQRAFKIAGAKTIIMSLWKVPDKETVELMELFYTNWIEKNMTKHDAFNNAQKEMRKKYDPYYWAAFVMVE